MMAPHRLSSNSKGDADAVKGGGSAENGLTNGNGNKPPPALVQNDEADNVNPPLANGNGNGASNQHTRSGSGSGSQVHDGNQHQHDHDASGENNNRNTNNNNPAKHDEWHDLGRFLPSNIPTFAKTEAAIERNSCMLEDLLATALEYDARMSMGASTSNSSEAKTQNDCKAHEHEIQPCASASGGQNHTVETRDNKNGHQQQEKQKQSQPQDVRPQDKHIKTHGDTSLLSPHLSSQIRAYVRQISCEYHHVGFHSFEHASHVMLSASKIVYMLQKQSPFNIDENCETEGSTGNDSTDNKAGETTQKQPLAQLPQLSGTIYDPWLHFAIALSALLHDVDHKGLPNNELLAECDPLADKYGGEECLKSYAEWNSLDIGLNLLKKCKEDGELAGVISDKDRFYKTVTDLVLCTDIASKERRELGMQKWEQACLHSLHDSGGDEKRGHFKRHSSTATLVIDNTSTSNGERGLLQIYAPEAARAISEQIMQAADVSHTMQHFSTFTKWNSHLYQEVLAAYQCGRTLQHQELKKKGGINNNETIRHPKENWYESQIGFFDHYIIPLAERLDACGAFSSNEAKFAPLAVKNKEQWILEGRECTRLMVEEAEGMELLKPMPVIPVNTTDVDDDETDAITKQSADADFKVEVKDETIDGADGAEDEGGAESMMMSEATLTTGHVGAPRRRRSSITLDVEADSSIAISEGTDEDSISVPGSVDVSSVPGSVGASSRVSFAGSSKAERRYSRRASVSSGEMGELEVDSSVNAIVPQILAEQLVDSLKADVQKSQAPPGLQASALRESISKYQSNGSCKRHRGALLFVDISGFTTLSQNYPVEDIKTFINQYFTKIMDLVVNFGGEVVKFAGDALYAIWKSDDTDSDGLGIEEDDADEVSNDGADSDGLCQSDRTEHAATSIPTLHHAMNIEKCTACAIAINALCNNYKVSKSYNTKRMSDFSTEISVDDNATSNATTAMAAATLGSQTTVSAMFNQSGEILYNFQDTNAEYKERGAVLNVYCGVSEGVMAGVDVVASNRAEFFLVGKPLKDVAKAEELAGPGELVVSPSVYDSLRAGEIVTTSSIASKLVFTNVESHFQRVSWPKYPGVADTLSVFKKREDDIAKSSDSDKHTMKREKRNAKSLIDELVHNTINNDSKDKKVTLASMVDNADTESSDSDKCSLQSNLMNLLEHHRHEASRRDLNVVNGKFTAELRKVVIIFISIMYEPTLTPGDSSQDQVMLENFQNIFNIISESVSSRSGQVRQFINDDKGTVFIASFGLRGSVTLHPCDTAVDAAKDAQNKLLKIMDIHCSIGITLGKIFCGETGSCNRYEYSLLGPSVNLSARLMAKGGWGEINCDEELKKHTTGRRHSFTVNGSYKLKGYEEPVQFYTPKDGCKVEGALSDERKEKNEERDDIVTFFMQKREVLDLVDDIFEKREMHRNGSADIGGVGDIDTTSKNQHLQPRIIIIKGNEDTGKDAFISAILNQPNLRDSSIVLEANRCFHDDPFYCFIPIITRILLSFSEPRERLVKLQKRYKRSSVLASFLANNAFSTKSFPRGTLMVPQQLEPFLSLVNDFVFKGFPLLKSSPETKRLKDAEKIEKCVEVLSALIIKYLGLRDGKPGIISICEIDKLDSYSKKLLCRMSRENVNLLIIGGSCDSSFVTPYEREPLASSTEDNLNSFISTILGIDQSGTAPINIEVKSLELLDKQNTFDLFRWSLRRDFPDQYEDICGTVDFPDIQDKIYQLCGGMAHVTAWMAHTFCTQFQKKEQCWKDNEDEDSNANAKSSSDIISHLQIFLSATYPTELEEIICFRMDQMKPEEQMLLKIASVAGFDQYSFSQNLLETVLLELSRSDNLSVVEEDGNGETNYLQEMPSRDDENRVPDSVGGIMLEESEFNHMFQGDYFEETLDSLVAHKFLDEVNVEMSDLSSMDSVMYRFCNAQEQSVINGLMLSGQKKRTHFEVALYYSSSSNKSGGGDGSSSENDSSSLSTDITSVPTTDWELFHLIALHYDLADIPIPAMLHYYDSSASLLSLGMRDKAHGKLLSSFLMFEKVLHHASTLDVDIDANTQQRRQIAGQMIKKIGNKELKDSMKFLTKIHLSSAFEGDIFAFKTGLTMLMKFGQSVGTIEEEGYLFGSELYLQTILLVLLVLEDEAFVNLTNSLGSVFGGEADIECVEEETNQKRKSLSESISLSSSDSCVEEFFDIDDLTLSFPAFSGLLTFYRDAPMGVNQVQETFLANLFVAVTQEANQMIHALRTKCILSHLYLKHGNIDNALKECEGIKEIYDHDLYSLELVNNYGMDWSLICVTTMTSTYLYKGQFSKARQNIDFLKGQMAKLDEFASSTKAMSKGNISSVYLLLHEFDNAAEIAGGINATQYGYFFKPIGVLQEELACRELALSQHKTFDSFFLDDDNLLSILSSDCIHTIDNNRPMFNQSAETLSDRGIEAVRAALCATEIRNLELQPIRNADLVRKQVRYCQAGLTYLRQSLCVNGANNHERIKNHFWCLHMQAHFLCWHCKLTQLLLSHQHQHQGDASYFGEDGVQVADDILGIQGTEIETARKSLDECQEYAEMYKYPFMQLLVGKSYIVLRLDVSRGELLIQRALESMDHADGEVAKIVLGRIDDMRGVGTWGSPNRFKPPSCTRGVPSAA